MNNMDLTPFQCLYNSHRCRCNVNTNMTWSHRRLSGKNKRARKTSERAKRRNDDSHKH